VTTSFLLVLIAILPTAGSADEATGAVVPLTFEQRVACVEKVEDVYWSHRVWPEGNPGDRPLLNTIVSRQEIAAGVDRSLLLEATIQSQWGVTVGPVNIQAELDRIAAGTRDPDLLRAVFAALDHDPYLVGECFVRPRLVERTARTLFSNDQEIHGELHDRAESALLAAGSMDDVMNTGAEVSRIRWLLDDGSYHGDLKAMLEDRVLLLTPAEWRDSVDRLAEVFDGPTDGKTPDDLREPVASPKTLVGRGFSPLSEVDNSFVAVHVVEVGDDGVTLESATWPKTSFDDWIKARTSELDPAEPAPGTYTLPEIRPKSSCVDDTWESITDNGASTPRYNFVSVWTGTELIIWGGDLWGTETNTGARYDLASDSWTATSTSNAPSARNVHRGVWTGTELIIWGGGNYPSWYNTGGRYNPATNSWTATSTTGAPSARGHHAAVWSGTEMIIWGGGDTTSAYATGGRYNPTSNTWTATSVTGAPSPRMSHSFVWTGTEMIIWGGNLGGLTYNDGARYSPLTDSWVPTSLTDAPEARRDHTAVWTGTEMIVWGGHGISWINTGGVYDPITDSWTATATTGAPSPRYFHSAVWTGTEMIIWGGQALTTYENTGGRYDPSGDIWVATSTTGAPAPRSTHAAAWPGATPRMIVTLGGDNSGPLQSGGLYCASGIVPYDFGDAPDPGYPTLLANDGARHRGGGPLFLGTTRDFEDDGQPTVNADGDDLDGTDDEDGVVFTSPANPGGAAGVDVVASEAGLLNAFVDFNADGDWTDPSEQVFTDRALVAGANSLSFAVPIDATLGETFARFRLSTTSGLGPAGYATDGEVEDSAVEIVEGPDLAIGMTASSEPVPSGYPLSYTLTVTNNGPLPATSVTVTDTLPGVVSFISSTPGAPDCSFAAGTLTCDLGAMAPTDTAEITVETVLDHPVWGSLSNTATVSAAETDPLTANNTATLDTRIALFVDGFESGATDRWSATVP
jgi:uncharacterized repeat protein (TIGR01451 family)